VGGKEAGARKQYTVLVQDQGLKVRAFISCYVALGQLTTIANGPRTIQQSNTGTGLPCEEL
jgi:hypothetical protein